MVLRIPVDLTVAGRTDAGVHATGQVAHCDVPRAVWEDQERRLVRRLRGVLPPDIAVPAVTEERLTDPGQLALATEAITLSRDYATAFRLLATTARHGRRERHARRGRRGRAARTPVAAVVARVGADGAARRAPSRATGRRPSR